MNKPNHTSDDEPRANSPLEQALYAMRADDPADCPAPGGCGEVSEGDLESIAAYAEGRMTRREAAEFRERLTNEPPLQAAMADFAVAVRGSDYGRAWTDDGVAGDAAAPEDAQVGRPPFWRSTTGLLFGAATAAVAMLAVSMWIADLLKPGDEQRQVAMASAYDERLSELASAFDRGDTSTAHAGYRELMDEPELPAATREIVADKFKSVTRIESRQAVASQQFDRAAQVAEEALSFFPDEPMLLTDAADARLLSLRQQRGDPTWLGIEPPQVATRSIAFEDPAEARELDAILDYYTRAAQADPANVRALLGQSEIYLERKDLTQADTVLSRAREIAPSNAAVQNALGRLFLRKGRDELARESFTKALEANPDHQPARLNLDSLFGANTTRNIPTTPTAPIDSMPQQTPPQRQESMLDQFFE